MTSVLDETIEIPPPKAITVLVYWSSTRAKWISKVLISAADIKSGEHGFFSNETESDSKPSRQELADQVVELLAHEVSERLGLNPHGAPEEPTLDLTAGSS